MRKSRIPVLCTAIHAFGCLVFLWTCVDIQAFFSDCDVNCIVGTLVIIFMLVAANVVLSERSLILLYFESALEDVHDPPKLSDYTHLQYYREKFVTLAGCDNGSLFASGLALPASFYLLRLRRGNIIGDHYDSTSSVMLLLIGICWCFLFYGVNYLISSQLTIKQRVLAELERVAKHQVEVQVLNLNVSDGLRALIREHISCPVTIQEASWLSRFYKFRGTNYVDRVVMEELGLENRTAVRPPEPAAVVRVVAVVPPQAVVQPPLVVAVPEPEPEPESKPEPDPVVPDPRRSSRLRDRRRIDREVKSLYA